MTDIPSWPRPHFTPSNQDAALALVAFGRIHLNAPIDRRFYRSAGLPAGCELVQFDRAQQPQGFAQFMDGPEWAVATADAPALAAVAAEGPHAAMLRGTLIDPATLDYLRDAVGLMTFLCDRGAAAVYDPRTMHLWTPAAWRKEVFAAAAPRPHAHAVILAKADKQAAGRTNYRTRGLKTFGRPDLSVRGVGKPFADPVLTLLNRYIDWLALGGVIQTGDRVKLAGLPPGGTCRRVDGDPAFDGSHVEIEWPAGAIGG